MATRAPTVRATVTSTRVVEPLTVVATPAPPPIVDIVLPPELPRIEGEVESAEHFDDRSTAMVWRVDVGGGDAGAHGGDHRSARAVARRARGWRWHRRVRGTSDEASEGTSTPGTTSSQRWQA